MNGWSDSDVEEVMSGPTPKASSRDSPDLFSERMSQFLDLDGDVSDVSLGRKSETSTDKRDGNTHYSLTHVVYIYICTSVTDLQKLTNQ